MLSHSPILRYKVFVFNMLGIEQAEQGIAEPPGRYLGC